MAMQAPSDDIDLENLQHVQELQRRRYTIGVVNPQGIVQEVVCAPDQFGKNSPQIGLEVVRMVESRIMLTSYGEAAGWTLLEQRCREDGCPEVYQRWRETVMARMDGHQIDLPRVNPKDPSSEFDFSSIYPPSVIEQRKKGTTGVSPKRFVPGRGLVDVDAIQETAEDQKTRVGKRARELGLGPTEAAP